MPAVTNKAKKAKSRKPFYSYMTPRFWRIHFLIPATIAFFSLGIALGIAHNTTMAPLATHATAVDNIIGWAWTPHVGWFSLNDTNSGACSSPPCGSYGINISPALSSQPHWDPSLPAGSTINAHRVNGFAWSDTVGFICFGSSCNIPACTGSFYPSPPGDQFYAYAEEITDTSTVEVHGWAVICNQKDAGWISLNCKDLNACDGSPASTYYKLVYNPSTQIFHNGTVTGSPFGWNGNTDGSGIGYVNFYISAAGMSLNPGSENCSDGVDNDLNGAIDCADSVCQGTPSCPEICDDGADNDGDTQIDCDDPDCAAFPACLPPPEICDDGADNDGDTLVDCDDPDCTGDPACAIPPQHQCLAFAGDPKQADLCCNDQDPNGPYLLDCLDPNCRDNAAVCSAWLQISTGNIYSYLGIVGTQPPAATNLFNSKWCLRTSDQGIEWTSEEDCRQEEVGQIDLPTQSTNYRNKLGFLDLAGMRVDGRYAPVVSILDAGGLPDQLNGKIYRFVGPGTFTLPAKTFLNGSGSSGNGGGLLLIEGGDLQIDGNIEYAADQVQSRLKNLASFGVVVVKTAAGGGDIIINPNVTKISGVYFAEGSISTGSTGTPPDAYLDMLGIFIANQFNLERDNNTDPTRPAERILFDGRAVVNPPPGLADISKSLPRALDVSF